MIFKRKTNQLYKEKLSKFGKAMVLRQLPISLFVAVGSTIADVADSLFVGNGMGEVGLAAIGLCLPVYMLMNIIIQGLGPGASIRYSSLMAEGKKEDALSLYRTSTASGLFIGIIIAIIINIFTTPFLMVLGVTKNASALFYAAEIYVKTIATGAPIIILSYTINDFMRNDDMENIAGIGSIIGNVVDFVLTIVLVFGAQMGVAGAGLATITGKLVSVAIYIVSISIKKSNLYQIYGDINPKKYLPICFKTGSSTGIQYLSDMIFLLWVNNILMRIAGESGVAVFDLIQVVSYAFMYLYYAFIEASQPAISTFEGEKNFLLQRRLKRFIIIMAQISGAIVAVICFIFAKNICQLFGVTDANTLSLGVLAIRIYCTGSVFMGTNLMLVGYYQASNNERGAYMVSTLRSIAILLPITLAFSLTNKEYFFFLYPVTEILSLIIFEIYAHIRKTDESDFDERRVNRFIVSNDLEELTKCVLWAEMFCEKWEAGPKQLYYVQMTIEEILTSIMKYGFKDESGVAEITLVCEENGDFSLHIRDNAIAFDPFSMENKKDEIDEDEIEILGMQVVKKKAKKFTYRRYMGFNSLIVKV